MDAPGLLTDQDIDARAPEREQIAAQVEKILLSSHLRQAKHLEKFLRYVVTKKLAGEEGELKEYTLGVEVFRRGDGFDPRTDSVVRVQANILRKKLAGYYGEEGKTDAVLIELPKGHYVPVFKLRQANTPAMAQASALVVAEDAPVAVEPTSLVTLPPVAALNEKASPGARWSNLSRAAAILLLGLVIALILQLSRFKQQNTTSATSATAVAPTKFVEPAYLPVWEKFLEPGAVNLLAYGAPQFFSAGGGIYVRDIRVNSAEELSADSRLATIQKDLKKPLTPTEVYTGVGETQGVFLLSRFLLARGHDLRVTRSRLLGWQDLKSANLIFLSSMRFHTLAKELSYQSDFVIAPNNEHVINLRPQPGEEKEYRHVSETGTKYDYAVVTLWPGKAPERRVLILGGSNTWTTLAAAEYVTEPHHLRQLAAHLTECKDRAKRPVHPAYFQVLLRVEIKDNQPVTVSYVTHHDVDPPPAPGEAQENTAAR